MIENVTLHFQSLHWVAPLFWSRAKLNTVSMFGSRTFNRIFKIHISIHIFGPLFHKTITLTCSTIHGQKMGAFCSSSVALTSPSAFHTSKTSGCSPTPLATPAKHVGSKCTLRRGVICVMVTSTTSLIAKS